MKTESAQGLRARLRKRELQELIWLGDFALDLVPAETEQFAKDCEIARIERALAALPAHRRKQVLAMAR